MGDSSQWLSVLFMVGALVVCAPWALRVLRTDRRVPHYIALWLCIALVLGLIYQFVGPIR